MKCNSQSNIILIDEIGEKPMSIGLNRQIRDFSHETWTTQYKENSILKDL